MHASLQNLIREATRLTQAGRLDEATAAIQRALGVMRADKADAASADRPADGRFELPAPAAAARGETHGRPERALSPAGAAAGAQQLGDGLEMDRQKNIEDAHGDSQPGFTALGRRLVPQGAAGVVREPSGRSAFVDGVFEHAGTTRRYKLYIPAGHDARALPLVVMLHGCNQSPEDFAAGTGMNARAGEQGFFVLYPEQAQEANPARCWNWFQQDHQLRGLGEPALIAAMAQALVLRHGMDGRRVYIAGLSAGGAMAAIVAAAYPDVFAAVGVHSGLAPGAADNLPDALAAMRGGAAGRRPQGQGKGKGPVPVSGPAIRPRILVPTIVFHGDQDRTVHPRNGEQVIAAAMDRLGATEPAAPERQLRTERGISAGGQSYTRSHHDAQGQAMSEHWSLHGAGHAWSGGRAEGSYTDPSGPDATGEMLRFFFAQPYGPAGH
ncbi:Esterase, PHB depolymerase [Thiomonas sp. X19]|uniref:extracellular catalytic domain type 1 short-chain-length polyhydroxyalkanoate depolymerase n=1 Tax=Thiomonas sp. X19 TaxID=1050370 RepID=UPI000B714736|nr:PHB depolymerase family esterase [Thiomonas sp. X19]SCC91201.1 Esterase, PHB depolymerase [Thiomonas sp. X19]